MEDDPLPGYDNVTNWMVGGNRLHMRMTRMGNVITLWAKLDGGWLALLRRDFLFKSFADLFWRQIVEARI